MAPEGLAFEEHGERYRLVEEVPYRLTNRPKLREELQKIYKMRFHGDSEPKYWYLGSEGKNILSKRAIKFEPTKTEAELRTYLGAYIDLISNENLKNSLKSTLEKMTFSMMLREQYIIIIHTTMDY